MLDLAHAALSRRHARGPGGIALVLALAVALAACSGQAAAPGSRSPAPAGSSAFRSSEMSALRTLKLINYFPARASWQYMWEDFAPAAIGRDMARMAGLHANGVRIIVSAAAFGFPRPDPTDLAELHQVIQLARKHGLRVQLTLFDQFSDWTAIKASRAWARAVLKPYAADREIAFTEIRNEINPASPAQMAWARDLLPYVQTLARGVPVTVSVTGGVPSLTELRRQLGKVQPDFWDLHYYGVAAGAYATFAAARAAVRPGLLYIGEFGFSTWPGNAAQVPGLPASQPEMDAYQAYYYASVEKAVTALGLPPAAPWTLNDFSRTHTPAQPSPAEYHFGMFRLDGSAKPAAAVISRFFATGHVGTSFGHFALSPGQGGSAPATPWLVRQPGGGTFGSAPGVTYSGHGSVRLSGTAASCPAYAATPPDGFVRPGQSVSVSVHVRGAAATGASGVSIVWMTASGQPAGPSRSSGPAAALGDGTTGWTGLHVASVAPRGAAYAQIDLISCANRGTVWFAGTRFGPAPAAAGA